MIFHLKFGAAIIFFVSHNDIPRKWEYTPELIITIFAIFATITKPFLE